MQSKEKKLICRNCNSTIWGKGPYMFHQNLCISMNTFQNRFLLKGPCYGSYDLRSRMQKVRKRKRNLQFASTRSSECKSPGGGNASCSILSGDAIPCITCGLEASPTRIKAKVVTGKRRYVIQNRKINAKVSHSNNIRVLSSGRNILGSLSTNAKAKMRNGCAGTRKGSFNNIDGQNLKYADRVRKQALRGMCMVRTLKKPSRKREKRVSYFCKPCDETLMSWQAIRKHLLSSEHLLSASRDRRRQITNQQRKRRNAPPSSSQQSQENEMSLGCPQDILMMGLDLIRVSNGNNNVPINQNVQIPEGGDTSSVSNAMNNATEQLRDNGEGKPSDTSVVVSPGSEVLGAGPPSDLCSSDAESDSSWTETCCSSSAETYYDNLSRCSEDATKRKPLPSEIGDSPATHALETDLNSSESPADLPPEPPQGEVADARTVNNVPNTLWPNVLLKKSPKFTGCASVDSTSPSVSDSCSRNNSSIIRINYKKKLSKTNRETGSTDCVSRSRPVKAPSQIAQDDNPAHNVDVVYKKLDTSYVDLGYKCDSLEFLHRFFGGNILNDPENNVRLCVSSLYDLIKHRETNLVKRWLKGDPGASSQNAGRDRPRTMIRYNYKKCASDAKTSLSSQDEDEMRNAALDTMVCCENVSHIIDDGEELNFSLAEGKLKRLVKKEKCNLGRLLAWMAKSSKLPVHVVYGGERGEDVLNSERFMDVLISRLMEEGLCCCKCHSRMDKESLVRHLQSIE